MLWMIPSCRSRLIRSPLVDDASAGPPRGAGRSRWRCRRGARTSRRAAGRFAELRGVPLVGQVQVADRSALRLTGTPRKRVHRRVVGGEPVRAGSVPMSGIRRNALADDQPEQTMAARRGADARARRSACKPLVMNRSMPPGASTIPGPHIARRRARVRDRRSAAGPVDLEHARDGARRAVERVQGASSDSHDRSHTRGRLPHAARGHDGPRNRCRTIIVPLDARADPSRHDERVAVLLDPTPRASAVPESLGLTAGTGCAGSCASRDPSSSERR